MIIPRQSFNLVQLSIISFGALISITLLSGCILTNTYVSAANTSADASVNVSAACTMTGSGNNSHTATITPGTAFTGNIGTTNIVASCNDPNGYSVYAIGYSGNPSTLGNTALINTNATIATRAYDASYTTSSYWSMKLTAGQGTDAATIVTTPTDYSTYVAVPSDYAKVATKTSATSASPTTAFSTTYGVYTTAIQAAGEYVGKVKYVLVHPNTAPAPPSPVVTNPGYISYNPNADGVTDSMGDQAIQSTDISANLWASNFQRSGYGFAGWTDKVDWALNQNDQNGNGTGSNAGYHIYGPNETISFTAGQYSGDNPGLSLYAVWVPSQGNLQGWTGCSSLSTGQVTALTDTRDNQTYAVAKLKDNKCWMIENLRLDNQYTTGAENIAKAQGYNLSFIGLANPETDNFTNSTVANSLYYSGTQSGTAIMNIGTNDYPGYRFPRYNNQNTSNPVNNMTTLYANIYSYGNYYTWSAAIADTSYYISGDHSTTSICPTGWHIPTGKSTGEYYILNMEQNSGSTSSSTGLRAYPANLIYSGHFYYSSASARGAHGYYWSSSSRAPENGYLLDFKNDYVNPGTSNSLYDGYKYQSRTIRCSL